MNERESLVENVSIMLNVGATEEDILNYRYAIYARKSTTSDEKQVQSLDDQVDLCQKLARKKELKLLLPPIRESMSAKDSGARPKFNQLIQDIKEGRCDGIIAWHPDRLSRNMKESGELIDLLDRGYLKDMKFINYDFINSGSGKMTLGITFALAKHYSDDLSSSIKRGHTRAVTTGKYPGSSPKHGYYVDNNKRLRPDGVNFALLREAWEMRLDEKQHTLDEIAEYLNSKGYQKATAPGGAKHKQFIFNKRSLSLLFKDSFYAGVVTFGDRAADFTITDAGFEPMVSIPEYSQINPSISKNKSIQQRRHRFEGVQANYLNHFMICSYCNSTLTPYISSKKYVLKKTLQEKITRRYYFECRNKQCPKPTKSLRGIAVAEYVLNILRELPVNKKKAIKLASTTFREKRESLLTELKTRIRSLKQTIRENEISINQKLGELETNKILNETAKELLSNQVNSYASQNKELADQLEKVLKHLRSLEESSDSENEFVEQITKLATVLEKDRTLETQDAVTRFVFSNIFVGGTKIVSYRLNPDFESVLNTTIVSSGRGGGTRTRGLKTPSLAR